MQLGFKNFPGEGHGLFGGSHTEMLGWPLQEMQSG